MSTKIPIQSTAGAVPLKNDKGELYMEKVKVSRYVSGKRPDYAPDSSDEEDDDLEFGFKKNKLQQTNLQHLVHDHEREDRRLRRLQEAKEESEDDEDEDDRDQRLARRRAVQEPEVLAKESDEEEGEVEDEELPTHRAERRDQDDDSSSDDDDDDELNEEEIERRRTLLRQKARMRQKQVIEEVMEVEEEKDVGSAEESSEYESEWESEEEDTGPRLKPVFVRKKDRITIQEKEKEAQRQRELEAENKRMAEERRKQSLKMVATEVKKELEEQKKVDGEGLDAVDTDDDNDEEEYEAWKVRELKRIKRDREERETLEKERQEIDQVHNMTEEERRKWQKENPKLHLNKAEKGKYKFLQKYYHRGVFFMDKDEDVYKRDFANPTLEDHFDKSVLPKVMQVKNFGRSGRTKYTHLVDQDTTQFESPWVTDTAMNLKFHTTKGGGMTQNFDKPSKYKGGN